MDGELAAFEETIAQGVASDSLATAELCEAMDRVAWGSKASIFGSLWQIFDPHFTLLEATWNQVIPSSNLQRSLEKTPCPGCGFSIHWPGLLWYLHIPVPWECGRGAAKRWFGPILEVDLHLLGMVFWLIWYQSYPKNSSHSPTAVPCFRRASWKPVVSGQRLASTWAQAASFVRSDVDCGGCWKRARSMLLGWKSTLLTSSKWVPSRI